MSRKTLVPVNLLTGTTAPATPTLRPGDTYYNTGDGNTYIYDGATWNVIGSGGSSSTILIFTGFDGGTATTTVFDLTLDIGAAV